MKFKIAISLIVCTGLFFFIKSTQQDTSRILNVYGFANGLSDDVDGDECVVKAIQIRKDSFFIDTCYAQHNEILAKYEKAVAKNENVVRDLSLIFKKRDIKKHKSKLLTKESIFNKLKMISTDKLMQMGKEINGYPCDSTFGVEIEVIENRIRKVIHLEDARNCGEKYTKFVQELIDGFSKGID